jgi:hypothetical protein
MSLKIEQGFRKGFDLGGDAAHGAYLRDRSDWKASHQDRGDHIIERRVDIRALSVLVLKRCNRQRQQEAPQLARGSGLEEVFDSACA